MNEFDELTAAAREARTAGPQFGQGLPTPPGGGSTPIVVAVIVAALIIGGAIVFWSLRAAPARPTATSDGRAAPQANSPADKAQAQNTLSAEIEAQRAAFDALTHRLPDALSRHRKAALDKMGAKQTPPMTYDCTLLLSRVGTHNAPDGRPIRYLAAFVGTDRGQAESTIVTDQVEITLALVPSAEDGWVIDSADETTTGHQSTAAETPGAAPEIGKRRDISDAGWLKDAVRDALNPKRH